ncbi:MAG: sugar phosphate nucleotidyltransferase, partial [Desertimonas sp.]
MHAVVLVGGFGTRLRPLTNSTPKPMLPVGNVTLLARLLAGLERGGVTEATLALGFQPEPFAAAFPDRRCGGVRLHYAVEPEPLDTAGAIRFAADHSGIDSTFVVANGDILTDLDVAELVSTHRSLGAAATLHLIAVDDPSAFGVADADPSGRIVGFVEKPPAGTAPSDLANAGTYVFEPGVLGLIPPGRRVSIERDTFPLLAAEGRLFGVPRPTYWLDAGRPDRYLRANLDLLDGKRRDRISDPVAPGAIVAADARLERSLVGAGASVGSGAVLTGSVVLPGAHIGDRATVIDSIVMGSVGAGARVRGVVLGAEGMVAAGAALTDASIPDPDIPTLPLDQPDGAAPTPEPVAAEP